MLEFFVKKEYLKWTRKKFDFWDEVIETFRRIEDEEKEHIRDFYQRNGGTEWIGM